MKYFTQIIAATQQLPATIEPSNITPTSVKFKTRKLIEWQLHTMARPSEASGALWDDINVETKLWTISADRMKTKCEHSIPLSPQALQILEYMRPISGNSKYIFPSDSDNKKSLSPRAIDIALNRLGLGDRIVAHHLRSLASTALYKQGYPTILIQEALSHTNNNFAMPDNLKVRKAMMCWWSNWINHATRDNQKLITKLINAKN